MIIACVETTSVVVTHSCPLYCHDLTLQQLILICIFTPKTYCNTQSRFICKHNISSIFLSLCLLYSNCSNLTYISDASNRVYRFHLIKIVDFPDVVKRKSLRSDLHIIFDLFDDWVLVEHNTEFILNTGELLVCNFYLSTSESVDLVFLNYFFVLVCLFIEKGCLNLLAEIVYQLNIE